MYNFSPEEVNRKLMALQAAYLKLMSQPKPDQQLATQLKRDIAFYSALQTDIGIPNESEKKQNDGASL